MKRESGILPCMRNSLQKKLREKRRNMGTSFLRKMYAENEIRMYFFMNDGFF